jgi:hypothetical protein
MDYTEYTSVKKRFDRDTNLCDLFKLLSIETWKRMEYAYLHTGVKVFETTITQNLLFTINAYNDQYKLDIDIFEAKSEKTNGNDFELIIKFPEYNTEYYAPVQAKKVYRNGLYHSMDHGAQIESLMRYAEKHDAQPLYLLYNYVSPPLRKGVKLTSPPELSGCTVINAKYLMENFYKKRTKLKRDGSSVKAWKIPSFYDLNPTRAFPWHELVCQSNPKELARFMGVFLLGKKTVPLKTEALVLFSKEFKQGFHPINTYSSGTDWLKISEINVKPASKGEHFISSEEIMYLPDNKSEKQIQKIKRIENASEKKYPNFSPRSRIVITKK